MRGAYLDQKPPCTAATSSYRCLTVNLEDLRSTSRRERLNSKVADCDLSTRISSTKHHEIPRHVHSSLAAANHSHDALDDPETALIR
ncbi:hypothetical protein BV898_01530 [Hypsibius exemplaris]|uniref:Uncharacterized protein n=1 Tax=Hypsibius exemplaris TaxID=2072580 RepID=A0A1W0XAB4_HYPEX|nr:hypothetical protein BV898_01530 [Hypsibius exemplaris]